MILRRFMQHVKEQNWFAVGLDVIVVIVGIFLGLQVQDWNEARENIAKEKIYYERLHSEVLEAIQVSNASLQRRTNIVDRIGEIIFYLDNNKSDNLLNSDHCAALIISHVQNSQPTNLPTIDELISNAQLAILQNENIKFEIIKLMRAVDGLETLQEGTRMGRISLATNFPDLIDRDLMVLDDLKSGKLSSGKCYYQLMGASNAFQNALMDNTARQIYLLGFMQSENEALKSLHAELDKSLDLSHTE